jgi:hypothetical protein
MACASRAKGQCGDLAVTSGGSAAAGLTSVQIEVFHETGVALSKKDRIAMVAETEQQRSQNGAAFARLLGKAWSDPAEKKKLLADPKTALTAVGFAIPTGATVKVLENTDHVMHVVDHPDSKTARFPAGKDPKTVLAAEGLAIPAGVAVNVVANTDKLIHVVLPLRPSAELSEAELEKVAGGAAGGPSIIRGYY